MGSEENLCECPSNGAVNMHSNCTTRSDAGIVCEGELVMYMEGGKEGGREGGRVGER